MSAFLRRLPPRMRSTFRYLGAVIWRAIVKYDETDAEQRAASFAYYAFFSIFPLILLLISIVTTFIGDQVRASRVIIDLLASFLPGQKDADWFVSIVDGVVKNRRSAGIIAFGVLIWSSLRFFQSLVRGVNKAWGTKEYAWWHLPIQNLFMVGIVASALLIGAITGPSFKMAQWYYWQNSWKFHLDFVFLRHVFWMAEQVAPSLILFYGLLMFYKFAPRRRTFFREVWGAALFATLALAALQKAFILYSERVADFNALYGALGSVVALLLWIYLTGSVIIIGGCISAARYEVRMHITDQSEKDHAG